VSIFLAFDLLTKEFIYGKVVATGDDIIVIKGVLEFTHAENTGAAWSIFRGQSYYLGIFSLVLSAAFLVTLLCLTNYRYSSIRFALTLIVGGALGNCVDRLRLEYVRDFLNYAFIDFPISNIADTELVIGLALLILSILIIYKPFQITKKQPLPN
jgi:signal peptidase II